MGQLKRHIHHAREVIFDYSTIYVNPKTAQSDLFQNVSVYRKNRFKRKLTLCSLQEKLPVLSVATFRFIWANLFSFFASYTAEEISSMNSDMIRYFQKKRSCLNLWRSLHFWRRFRRDLLS